MKFAGKILLVDDELHIRKYVSLIVKQLGNVTVVEAVNGEDAIAVFERERPQIVLLDVNMPRLGGIETLKRLKAIDPACIVIMLTSLANRETVEKALEHGAVHYIRKDTPKEEIAAALTEAIDSATASS
jgi:two-component system, chemotaxis family, chemotaxis protein CheY